MSEEQVREPDASYTAPTAAEAGEHLMEQLQVQFPPYFDRFLAERDRRIASELGRLEAAVEHNGAEIARVLREMDRRFAEAKEERDHRFAEAGGERVELRAEMDRRFAEAKEERDHRFAEAKVEREVLRTEVQALRAEMHSQFRWTIGLLFPLVVGMLAVIIRVFFVGTF